MSYSLEKVNTYEEFCKTIKASPESSTLLITFLVIIILTLIAQTIDCQLLVRCTGYVSNLGNCLLKI